jgi:hypothetical protein
MEKKRKGDHEEKIFTFIFLLVGRVPYNFTLSREIEKILTYSLHNNTDRCTRKQKLVQMVWACRVVNGRI